MQATDETASVSSIPRIQKKMSTKYADVFEGNFHARELVLGEVVISCRSVTHTSAFDRLGGLSLNKVHPCARKDMSFYNASTKNTLRRNSQI